MRTNIVTVANNCREVAQKSSNVSIIHFVDIYFDIIHFVDIYFVA